MSPEDLRENVAGVPPELTTPNYRMAALTGIGYDPNLDRQDPSNVIKVGDTFYAWYTQRPHDVHAYASTVYYAASTDGLNWQDRGQAIDRGAAGEWDSFGVITPYIAVIDGKYYLFYTGTSAAKPFRLRDPDGTLRHIGVAIADSPDGPWTKFDGNPVLSPTADAWDSLIVDDTHLIVRNGKYWLYYKGGHGTIDAADTEWGLAMADRPTGPYRKHCANPLIGGHTVCVWPHREGIAALVDNAGPERFTVQWSPDGIRFRRVAKLPLVHTGCGPYDADAFTDTNYGRGIRWGVAQAATEGRLHIVRFDVDLTAPALGERLYNGIQLPPEWPPRHLDPVDLEPMPTPYLDNPPSAIPIEVGRQLFVDDFLIESTTLDRELHLPEKHPDNPVLAPETELEMNDDVCPLAAPFGDGVLYDPVDNLFKMWYHAGWFDGVALAISRDGLRWERPQFDVVPGTNRVIPPREDFRRDGVSVWFDHETADPAERFKMFLYARSEEYGTGGRLWTSPDGIRWTERVRTDEVGDNTSMFYNPFRKRWVLSIRSSHRDRTRDYREHADFLKVATWQNGERVFWAGVDELDLPDPAIGHPAQLYKIEAAPYESLMLGLFQIHHGPPNNVCLKGGYPKNTHLQVAFSRDGFHWHRPSREFFIAGTKREGDWDRAYIHAATGGCLVIGDKLHFYYGAWSGASPRHGGHMYAGGATGLATLRRDGFVSMNAGADGGTLTTRAVTFDGRYLFVNVDGPDGELRAELLDRDGAVVAPFSAANCQPVAADSTLRQMVWQGADDLSALAGKPVRFRFHLKNGALYAFWVSPDQSGASHGYVAAGGPGFNGPTDTVGKMEV